MTQHRAKIRKAPPRDVGAGWFAFLYFLNEPRSRGPRWQCVGWSWEPTWPRVIAAAEAYVRTGDPYPSDQLIELWERRLVSVD